MGPMGSELPEQPQSERRPRPILDEVMGMKERLSRMESVIQQAASLAVVEARRVDEIKETFEATVAAYEAQLQGKETTPNRESTVPGEQDQGLVSQIRELENRVREKGELLEIREAELKDLRSKGKAEYLAATKAVRLEEIKGNFEAAVAALVGQLREKDDKFHQKDSAFKELEESLTGQIRDLENRLREKEEPLVTRDAEIEDLRSKVDDAAALAAAEAGRVQEIERNFAATLAALKTQLGVKEELLSQKDIAMKDMEEGLTGLEESLVNQIRILEDQLEEMVQKSGSEKSEQDKKAKGKKGSPRSPKQA